MPVRPIPIPLLLLGIASSAALAQSEPAAHETASPPPAEPTAAAEDDPEIVVEGDVPKERRRVCETRVTTGSIMPKRVCRTVEQREEERQAAHEAMERISRDREARSLVEEVNGTGAP